MFIVIAFALFHRCYFYVIVIVVINCYYDRLLVGHTHEDIDAVFALIWEAIKDICCMSPQQYKAMILQAVRRKEAVQDVVDIFSIPDYSKFLEPFRGYKHFGRAFKGDLTVHQFVFTKVEVSEKFPTGVEVTHRRFATEHCTEVTKIQEGEEVEDSVLQALGYRATDTVSEFVAPYQILDRLPNESDHFYPEGFVVGSADQLRRVSTKIKAQYSSRVDILDHWKTFVENAPNDDEAEHWLEIKPLYIPFHEALFGDALVHSTAAPMMKKARNLPTIKARDTVKRKGYKPPREKKKESKQSGDLTILFLLFDLT